MAVPLRRERLRLEMIEEIMAAARLLLEKGGPGAISVRAIARQVGVTTPAIYRYFPSRDALIAALNDSVISELCAVIESAGDQPAAFRRWALDHPASFRLTLGLDGRPAGGQTLPGRLPRLSAPRARPETRLISPGAASMLSWATLCGLVLLELACDREDLPEDIDQLYEAAAAK